jgi:polyisoprenyl-phosphate glycosyltransferase
MHNRNISVVVPVYNSKDTIELLVDRVSQVMSKAQMDFELILIDDGSIDGSFEEIRRLSKQYSFIRGYRLSRNFGHQAALTIGLQYSRENLVAIIDDDLQDPPEILPDFIQRLNNDEADVVYGIRKDRKESFTRILLYAVFYRILRVISNIEVPMDAGDFCVMRRCVVDAMLQLREASPFLRGIRSWVGFRQIGIKYQRAPRLQGVSGYTWKEYFRFAATGIFSFSHIPLRVATILGVVAGLIGFVFAGYILFRKIIGPFDVPGYASLIVVISLLGGSQLICLGIIGEYLARLGDNTRKWPIAIVADSTEESS